MRAELAAAAATEHKVKTRTAALAVGTRAASCGNARLAAGEQAVGEVDWTPVRGRAAC